MANPVPAAGYRAGCVQAATALGVPAKRNTVPAASQAFAVLEHDGDLGPRPCPMPKKNGDPCGGYATDSGVCAGHTRSMMRAQEPVEEG